MSVTRTRTDSDASETKTWLELRVRRRLEGLEDLNLTRMLPGEAQFRPQVSSRVKLPRLASLSDSWLATSEVTHCCGHGPPVRVCIVIRHPLEDQALPLASGFLVGYEFMVWINSMVNSYHEFMNFKTFYEFMVLIHYPEFNIWFQDNEIHMWISMYANSWYDFIVYEFRIWVHHWIKSLHEFRYIIMVSNSWYYWMVLTTMLNSWLLIHDMSSYFVPRMPIRMRFFLAERRLPGGICSSYWFGPKQWSVTVDYPFKHGAIMSAPVRVPAINPAPSAAAQQLAPERLARAHSQAAKSTLQSRHSSMMKFNLNVARYVNLLRSAGRRRLELDRWGWAVRLLPQGVCASCWFSLVRRWWKQWRRWRTCLRRRQRSWKDLRFAK